MIMDIFFMKTIWYWDKVKSIMVLCFTEIMEQKFFLIRSRNVKG